MLVEKTAIPGVYIITPPVFSDNRGSVRPLVYSDLGSLGISASFEQFNVTTNVRGATRGMYWQPGQSKLCMVASGEAWDVVLDVRIGSPTFGKIVEVSLSETNGKAIYIPEGCAHGFQALENWTTVLYFMNTRWEAKLQRGVSINDPRIDSHWPIPFNEAIIAQKDRDNPYLGILGITNPGFLPRYANGSR